MKKKYDHRKIEKFVQNFWDENKTFVVKENKNKKKYYCLSMIPYPSGNLHMGHIRNYTIGDIISRYQRMLGKNVLQPIGWDAFGLPAEIAAMKNNKNPADWTYKNIKIMKKQLKSLGYSYDWSRELITCKPEYYKWEQWFFTKLYKNGLVYKKKTWINWCKKDETVLANEQVINGKCWRCNNEISQRKISQWFIKITDYAEKLHNDLKNLTLWPEKVKVMQRNWIGKTKGMEIQFNVLKYNKKIKVFIINPRVLIENIYINISIEHKLTKYLIKNDILIFEFVNKYKKLINTFNNTINKNVYGINTKMFAINPINKKKIPIWISNYYTTEYNYYAKICIPSINENDLQFAEKYNIYDIKLIKEKKNNLNKKLFSNKTELFNFLRLNNLTSDKLNTFIKSKLLIKKQGKKKVKYKLRDWNISRQRYWGSPIPIGISKKGIIQPVPKNQLPIILPEKININKKNDKVKLKYIPNEIKINKKTYLLENETFDTFIESSWYYARYTCPKYNAGMLDSQALNYWLPIDCYIGGIEHATMHLLYFRFYHKLLKKFGLVRTSEPAEKLLCQGMVLSDTFYYTNKNNERTWVSNEDVTIQRDKKGRIINIKHIYGKKIIYNGKKKMSKSKNNGINPEKIIKKYGADTLRLFIIFAAPINMPLEWDERGIKGMNRFLHRVWNIILKYKEYKKHNLTVSNINIQKQISFQSKLYETVKKVSEDIQIKQTFNTAIASIMKLINSFKKEFSSMILNKELTDKIIATIIKILYPFTPHFCFILWKEIFNKYNLDQEKWPIIDKDKIINKKLIIVIQINGKKRSIIHILNHTEKKEIESIALKKINKYLNNKKIKKIIYIPNKVLNIVTN